MCAKLKAPGRVVEGTGKKDPPSQGPCNLGLARGQRATLLCCCYYPSVQASECLCSGQPAEDAQGTTKPPLCPAQHYYTRSSARGANGGQQHGRGERQLCYCLGDRGEDATRSLGFFSLKRAPMTVGRGGGTRNRGRLSVAPSRDEGVLRKPRGEGRLVGAVRGQRAEALAPEGAACRPGHSSSPWNRDLGGASSCCCFLC